MDPHQRVRTVRRTAAGLAAVAVILVPVAMFVGLPIPGMVVTLGLCLAVIAAVIWLVTARLERRDAHHHAAQGQSWRPDGGTTR
ncbi:hypothetical protein [uncultured Pseudokineococcus sp.]|uniref:hypothetical protein n=1 Tax=uncultured Pseudokineococcus sp. TaxID=1642928 RepID=UPI002627757C|nr:hypothetical protein [uncultured Pseudokineococcus sp.]